MKRIRAMFHLRAGAFAAVFALASGTAGADERLDTIRRQVFQPQFLALGQPAPVGIVGGMPTPIGRPLSHKHCRWQLGSTSCEIEVTYGVGGTSPNNCAVAVADVWMLGFGIENITWTIKQTSGGRRHRFYVEDDGTRQWGILFADSSNDPNDGTSVPRQDVFDLITQNDDFVQMRLLHDIFGGPLRRGQPKAFYYAIRLQREKVAGGGTADPATWEKCDPYDPVAVNRGN